MLGGFSSIFGYKIDSNTLLLCCHRGVGFYVVRAFYVERGFFVFFAAVFCFFSPSIYLAEMKFSVFAREIRRRRRRRGVIEGEKLLHIHLMINNSF